MSDMNQIEIPQSFMALFLTPGRDKPNAPQETVIRRYELCEDMACMLAERAPTMLFSSGLGEEAVLLLCRQGLLADTATFNAKEADWVIHRLAELLGWTAPRS